MYPTQWEYCEIRQEIAQGVMHRQYILFYRIGEDAEKVSISNREAATAQLGLEGWEMIGTSGSFTQDSTGFRVFFKRPFWEENE